MTFAEWVARELESRAADRAREQSPAAGVYQRIADDVRAWWREWYEAPLPMATAVEESGYTENGLRRFMRKHGLPHLTRATLPRRGGIEAAPPKQDPRRAVTRPRRRHAAQRAPGPSTSPLDLSALRFQR